MRSLGKWSQAVIGGVLVGGALTTSEPAEAWYNRGVALLDLKQYEKALISFNRTIEIEDNVPEFWHSKGCLHGILRDYAEAMKDFDHALELNPEFAMAWKSRGLFLQYLGRFQEAVESYDRSLVLEYDAETKKMRDALVTKI